MEHLITHYIDGGHYQRTHSDSATTIAQISPVTGVTTAEILMADVALLDMAVASAKEAQKSWGQLTPQRRAEVMFRFKRLIEEHMGELAALLSSEHGKTHDDARGDIQRGLDVVTFACGIPHLLKGAHSSAIGPEIDMFSMRQPLGVVAGITPFNFPAMIPMWMFAIAIACGNSFILKPSEKDPSVPVRLAELLTEAGLPAGVLQVVHGDRFISEALADHPDIAALSFVGSTPVAAALYARAAAVGKRVQAMGGAKNHAVIMPDADLDIVVKDLLGAAYGSAGERCMALSVAVVVGEETADQLVARLAEKVPSLSIGLPQDNPDFGPLITAEHKANVSGWIEKAKKEGASLVVDGRTRDLSHLGNGHFLGATLMDNVTQEMTCYQHEIFGPVLQVMRVPNLADALKIIAENPYGNGAAIFTRDGAAARHFAHHVGAGMVGINVAIPVPLAFHSFGGWKGSAFGDLNQHGPDGVAFYTKAKTVTQRWPTGASVGAGFNMPLLG